ncbi:MAG: hypothetical protein JST44_18765 [Cyanobacteria bacterium SZAS LIN-5]|nr:hypothetical protein [Cyanobacteria bacterium SZAS LIN-5]
MVSDHHSSDAAPGKAGTREVASGEAASREPSQNDPQQMVARLLPKLRNDRITYFPVRHHSPACAALLERWILEHKPASILVEGPSNFNSRINLLTEESCKCPVALFTNFIDKKERLKKLILQDSHKEQDKAESHREQDKAESHTEQNKAESHTEQDKAESNSPQGKEDSHLAQDQADSPPANDKADSPPVQNKPDSHHFDFGPPRFSAYYPFCDYSPELVALRTGRKIGARMQFIDLQYGEMILNQYKVPKKPEDEIVHIDSLAEDEHLKKSRYIQALSREMGCRDFDELWDHLFEAGRETLSVEAFIDRLTTYCAMARLEYTQRDLEADGTVAREACMAEAIVEEMGNNGGGKILVVTGGFHTVALPDLVEQKVKRPKKIEFTDEEQGMWLMRFSFDRLDSLAGYSAGMPSPAFYDRLWHSERSSEDASTRAKESERVGADFIVEISRRTRELMLPNLITTPDSIAALQMAKQLANLRGHPWPMREDVLDGIRSCCVKGEVNIEGAALSRIVKQVLAGDRIGELPPGCDMPPIVDDFYKEAKRFKIALDRVERKEFSLDLYRNANHRNISRFFHRLSSLDVPFARFLDGPDFVHGMRLDLLIEKWETNWSPNVESGLIEASTFGTTIEEAAATQLRTQLASLEDSSQGRSSAAAVELLIRACRLGLHAQSLELVPLIDIHIAEDPLASSAISALSQLELLLQAREPLEATHLTAVPRLMTAAYHRACHLLHDMARCPAERVEEFVGALKILREIVNSVNHEFDTELFFNGLKSIIDCPPHEAQSMLVGAAAGILYGESRIDDEKLIAIVCGFLGGTINDPKKTAGILRGLLTTACEIAWQVAEVIHAIDAEFQNWDEETFLNLLPELRLAFSLLTPSDISRVAEKVSNLYEGVELGPLVHYDISESDLQLGLSLNERVLKILEADGLHE